MIQGWSSFVFFTTYCLVLSATNFRCRVYHIPDPMFPLYLASTSKHFILLHWFICWFLCQYQIILIFIAFLIAFILCRAGLFLSILPWLFFFSEFSWLVFIFTFPIEILYYSQASLQTYKAKKKKKRKQLTNIRNLFLTALPCIYRII